MKGIIYNAVEEAVTELYSADTWDDLVEAAGIDGSYTAIGTYDDNDLGRLVTVGCEATGLDAGELVRALGRQAFGHLARRHPEFLVGMESTRAFLVSVEDIIHPEVMKLHPDATPPRFSFEDLPDGTLRMTYHSQRKLGVLAEGLIYGASDWFGEEATITLVDGAGAERTTYDIALAPAAVTSDA